MYLGHKIDKDGIRPDSSRVTKLQNFTPRTKKDIMKIMGLIQWYRPFQENLSSTTSFLTEKLKKENSFSWDKDDANRLEKVISEIKTETLSSHPDLNKPFTLETDASNIGIGAVLYQDDKTIGFYSHKLKGAEQNYTVVEKECFAILMALTHFRNILIHGKINIRTDCHSLP